jgi:hypothetical protein
MHFGRKRRSAGTKPSNFGCAVLFSIVAIFGYWMTFASGLSAQTVVDGNITTDTVWNLDGSPYLITRDVIVRSASRAGAAPVLTIEAGVEVRFSPGTGLQIADEFGGVYRGALDARGTFDAPIVFTSNAASPAAGD